MKTQNEIKAKEIIDKFYGSFVPFHAHNKAFEECVKAKYAILEAMEWKQDQLIDKACEWLEPVFKNYAGYYCGTDLVDDFRKYMKGE